MENDADICYVSHDEDDGSWQVLCAYDNHIESDARIISLKQVFDLDNSVGQLANMPLGCYGVREQKDASWQVFKND